MTHVYCFSATGRSWKVADYIAGRLGTEVRDLEQASPCRRAVVVFPVYCQNLPLPVKDFLPRLAAEQVALLAVYGGMSPGNVLWEAQRLVPGQVIAGGTIPTGHTYLEEPADFERAALEPLFERLPHPRPVTLPKGKKVWYADLLPAWRSRMGVKLFRSKVCTGCGLCSQRCPSKAVCIRCLRCVAQCPKKALSFRLRPIMKRYLSKRREHAVTLYL